MDVSSLVMLLFTIGSVNAVLSDGHGVETFLADAKVTSKVPIVRRGRAMNNTNTQHNRAMATTSPPVTGCTFPSCMTSCGPGQRHRIYVKHVGSCPECECVQGPSSGCQHAARPWTMDSLVSCYAVWAFLMLYNKLTVWL